MLRDRDAVITGIGLVSCLGDGLDAHRRALADFRPVIDETRFAPAVIHPPVTVDFDRHISRRDQRQMELCQRLGTYAAGQALELAGLKNQPALLERMEMIVATPGGERDVGLDEAMLSQPASPDPEIALNLGLVSGLRPTLFLAQLPNMLAGCISIAHGVAGSSRTFMGEEACGAEAVRIACARIAAGQGDLFLVGGAQSAARPELLLQYALGGLLATSPFTPIWARQQVGGGMNLGSLGCFLVLESRAHAGSRGAPAIASIAAIGTGRCLREPGQAGGNAARQLEAMRGLLDPPRAAVISGASGVLPATTEERAFLDGLGLPTRAVASALGHAIEPAFFGAIALASLALADGRLFPPLEPAEQAMNGELRQALVTGWGHWRGEALALITRV